MRKKKLDSSALLDWYFIGIGQFDCFYTLRHGWNEYKRIHDDVVIIRKTSHIQNLSQNPKEAFAKAKILVANIGGTFVTSEDHFVEQLAEIKRRAADEVRREKEAKFQATLDRTLELHSDWAKQNDERTKSYRRLPFGKLEGKTLWEAWELDPDYLKFIADSNQYPFGDFVRAFIEGRESSIPESHHVGEEKVRQVFEAVLLNKHAYESMWGTGVIYTFRDNKGNELVWFCSGDPIKVAIGDTVSFKATVKRHGDYKGKEQTYINRLKVVA